MVSERMVAAARNVVHDARNKRDEILLYLLRNKYHFEVSFL